MPIHQYGPSRASLTARLSPFADFCFQKRNAFVVLVVAWPIRLSSAKDLPQFGFFRFFSYREWLKIFLSLSKSGYRSFF